MGKDKYAMFVSHINHTKILKNSTTIKEPGFEVEVDVQFIAHEDTEIVITALGFEVPENKYYYMNGERFTYEDQWNCLNAWSNYLEIPLFQVESGKKYYPKDTVDNKITIKKGEEFWLSSVIENYRCVPFFRPVHLLADFEITEGLCDINVAALRSNGTLGDRSHHNPRASFARYIKDRQYKGVADSLNQVSCTIDYTIDASVYNGTKFPVLVHNQHAPKEGNWTQTWVSHINPKANIPTQFHVVETDMLKFKYKDDSKLRYYGTGIPKDEQEDVWYFDTYHSDSSEYPGKSSGYTKRNYSPNYEIPANVTDYTTCNLGNYGVKEQYKVNITNDGWTTRYVNYNLYTESNVIVILKDKDGNLKQPYGLCKGTTKSKEEDVILSIPLPPQQTTSFILEIILPTNCTGAIMNSLEIVNAPTNIMVYEPSVTEYSKDYGFTGEEFVKWINGDLYTSTDLENWTKQNLTNKTKKIFDGTWEEFEIQKIPDGYMAKATLYDGTPYYSAQEFYKNVYFLDKNFNLVSKHEFGYYPSFMSYADGVYYVYAGGVYTSPDKKNWTLSKDPSSFPQDNGSGFSVKMNNTDILVSDGEFLPVVYQGEKPKYIDKLGDMYFYADGENLYTSKNGIYWFCTQFEDRIDSIYRIGNKFTVNKRYTKNINCKDIPIIKLKDRFLGFDIYPEISSDGISYAPLRFISENLGCDVLWNADDKSTTVIYGEKSAVFIQNDGYMKNGTFMIPVRTLCTKLGFETEWNNGIITIK